MTHRDDTPTAPMRAPRPARRASSASFRALRPKDQADMYASEVATERVRALSYDEEHALGATAAHALRPIIREWAREDFAAGASRVADLETALSAARAMVARLQGGQA